MKFEERTDILLFEGTNGVPAVIRQLPKTQGADPVTLRGDRILYNRKTHEFLVEGVKTITP